MAQAASVDTRSIFIAKLLAPLSSPREARRLAAEVRRDAERAWSIAHHRYYAALSHRDHAAHVRIAAVLERRNVKVPEIAEEQRAQLALLAAVDYLMHVPAPSRAALRQKQKLRKFDGGRDRWEEAIAADEQRFEGSK